MSEEFNEEQLFITAEQNKDFRDRQDATKIRTKYMLMTKEEFDAWEIDNKRRSARSSYREIVNRYIGKGGSSKSFNLKPEVLKQQIEHHPLHELLIERDFHSGEIEDIKEAIPLIEQTKERNKKQRSENGYYVIERRTQKGTFGEIVRCGEETFDNLLKRFDGEVAILKLALHYNEELLQVYEGEIAERERSPKLKEILERMGEVAKQAQKLKPIIAKANEKAKKSLEHSQPDLKTCRIYIDTTAEFSNLQTEYLNLQTDLAFYTNEPQNIPAFPALTSEEISAESSIKETYRRHA